MNKKLYKIGLVIFSALPMLASAQLTKTAAILGSAAGIVETILIPLAFTMSLLLFFWGVAKYIWSVAQSGKEDGRKIMVWGVIALFVISSVWGLVAFLGDELLGGSTITNMAIPTIGE